MGWMTQDAYSGRGKRFFSRMPKLILGPTQPPFSGCQGSFLAVMWLEWEVNHSLPYGA